MNRIMSILMINSLLLLSSFILATILLFISISSNHHDLIYAQFQNNNNNTLLGVNITSPAKGQQIPVGSNLTVSGKSTDNPAYNHDCQVSVIVNSIKPYQPAVANGTIGEGKSDYSRWYFVLSSSYTSIKEGVNEITAKLSCLSSLSNNNNNLTKWYSVNVTGIPTADNITIPIKSSSVIPNNNEPQSSETNDNEVQKTIIDNNNDDNGDKIHEKLKNLMEKINERVKERLKEQGIESNLPSSSN
jgi:hypothetical protein